MLNGKIYYAVQEFDRNGNLLFTFNETTLVNSIKQCEEKRKNHQSHQFFIKPFKCAVFDNSRLKTYCFTCDLECGNLSTSKVFNDMLLSKYNFVNL